MPGALPCAYLDMQALHTSLPIGQRGEEAFLLDNPDSVFQPLKPRRYALLVAALRIQIGGGGHLPSSTKAEYIIKNGEGKFIFTTARELHFKSTV